MSIAFQKRLVIFSLIFTILVSVDQLSKKFAFLEVCNRGIAFGLNIGNCMLFILVLLLVLFFAFREINKLVFVGLSAIFAGGFSNFLDRILLGCVRDFISIYKMPIFNIADVFITLGVFAIFLGYIIRKSQ